MVLPLLGERAGGEGEHHFDCILTPWSLAVGVSLELGAWCLELSLRLRTSFLQSQRPFDAAQNVFLIRLTYFFRILTLEICRRIGLPDIFAMPEVSIENSALAIFFAPGNRIIAGRFIIW